MNTLSAGLDLRPGKPAAPLGRLPLRPAQRPGQPSPPGPVAQRRPRRARPLRGRRRLETVPAGRPPPARHARHRAQPRPGAPFRPSPGPSPKTGPLEAARLTALPLLSRRRGPWDGRDRISGRPGAGGTRALRGSPGSGAGPPPDAHLVSVAVCSSKTRQGGLTAAMRTLLILLKHRLNDRRLAPARAVPLL